MEEFDNKKDLQDMPIGESITETKIVEDKVSSKVDIIEEIKEDPKPKKTYKKKEVQQSRFVKEFRSLLELKEFIDNLPEKTEPCFIHNHGVNFKYPMIKFSTVVFKTVETSSKLTCDILATGEELEKFVNSLNKTEIIGIANDYISKKTKSDLQYLVITKKVDEDVKYVARNFFERNSWDVFEKYIVNNPTLEIVYMSTRAVKPQRNSAQIYLAIFKE